MAIHFTRDEFDQRRDAVVRALKGRGLFGILLFKQESMYYLIPTAILMNRYGVSRLWREGGGPAAP